MPPDAYILTLDDHEWLQDLGEDCDPEDAAAELMRRAQKTAWRRATESETGSLGRTGARWSLTGAEAILRLRALRTSGDFDDYWLFHLAKEHERTHQSRYADGAIPNPLPAARPVLRLVK